MNRGPLRARARRLAARLRRPRIQVLAGFAGAAVLLVTLGATAVPTDASFSDAEWGNGTIGTASCSTTTDFSTRAAGHFLGTSLLNLDDTVGAGALTVTTSGAAAATPTPSGSTPGADPNSYADPLDASVLGGAVSASVLAPVVLPLDARIGAMSTYARADGDGTSTGATGLITDHGAIGLSTTPDAGLPTSADLSLQNVVGAALGSGGAALAATVASTDLRVGAVASQATLDGCGQLFGASLASSLARDYRIADLTLGLTSSLVSQLVSTAEATEAQLQTAVDGFGVSDIVSGVTGLLAPLGIAGLGVTSTASTLAATIDLTPVDAALTSTYSDSQHLVTIDPGNGTVRVDLGKLLGGVNGLNTLAPNTQLLVNPAVATALTDAAVQALASFQSAVTTAVTSAVDGITVNGTANLTIAATLLTVPVPVATVSATIDDVSARSLANGTGSVSVAVSPVGATCPSLDLVCTIVDEITTPLTTGIGTVVGDAVLGLTTTATTGLTTSLTALTGPASSLVSLIGGLTSGLFGPAGVASLLANAQNAPTSGGPPPGDPSWTTMPAGRYDVAALHVAVLGLLSAGDTVDIDLARSSVGPNTRLP